VKSRYLERFSGAWIELPDYVKNRIKKLEQKEEQ
jgi:hypothetical protein